MSTLFPRRDEYSPRIEDPDLRGDRGEAGVCSEVAGGRDVFAGDFGEESGRGPDADPGHARQDGLKRVRINHSLNLGRDLVTLPPKRCQLRCEAREHERSRVRAGDDDGLLAERNDDLMLPFPTLAGR